MTYRVYIKNDYKPVVRWVPDQPWYRRAAGRLALWGGVITAVSLYLIIPSQPQPAETVIPAAAAMPAPVADTETPPPATHTVAVHDHAKTEEATAAPVTDATVKVPPRSQAPAPVPWKTTTVARGDNLSLIFDRMGLSPAVLYQVLHTDKRTADLKHLLPGQKLHFQIDGQGLKALKYEEDLVTSLEVNRDGDGFTSKMVTTPLETRNVTADATIKDSLFLAGQQAGMSDKLIMQMVAIYGWDIDFIQDIRSGDHFKVLYQEQYKNGVKVGEGPILAAEFVNQGRSYKAIRYTSADGHTDYYNENGASMRKAFLRTPVKFTRISSRFSLHRLHPILGITRPHEGVDYAAPRGTPIKATGDGVVAFLGRKGGYGRTIILKHGGRYSTLYGHMSGYARHLHAGSRVKQGQIIGYVGMSGLATGPHLHYEFRVNGVHRNPLTVKLPKAKSIPKQYLADFKLKSTTLLAELEQPEEKGATVVAMRDEDKDGQKLPANY